NSAARRRSTPTAEGSAGPTQAAVDLVEGATIQNSTFGRPPMGPGVQCYLRRRARMERAVIETVSSALWADCSPPAAVFRTVIQWSPSGAAIVKSIGSW